MGNVKELLEQQKFVKLEIGEKVELVLAKDPLAHESKKNKWDKNVIEWEFKDVKGNEKIFTTGSLGFMRAMSKFKVGDKVTITCSEGTGQAKKFYKVELAAKGNGDLPF